MKRAQPHVFVSVPQGVAAFARAGVLSLLLGNPFAQVILIPRDLFFLMFQKPPDSKKTTTPETPSKKPRAGTAQKKKGAKKK